MTEMIDIYDIDSTLSEDIISDVDIDTRLAIAICRYTVRCNLADIVVECPCTMTSSR